MWVLVLFTALALSDGPQVELRDSEVWIIRNGIEKQLTHDGKPKSVALLSPAQNRIAYYEECAEEKPCQPRVVVLSLTGRRISAFPFKSGTDSCTTVLDLAWAGNNAVAGDCHINPSLGEYVEVSILTGRVTRQLLGGGFTRSTNGKWVAHAGWIVHWGPPYAKSDYLQLDNLTIYPLPKGMGPVEQKGLTEPPNVIRKRGVIYSGIHRFLGGPSWSPDSQRIALIDCTFDWTEKKAGEEDESNERCSLVVVTRTGKATLFPISTDDAHNVYEAPLSWTGVRRLSLRIDGVTKSFTIP